MSTTADTVSSENRELLPGPVIGNQCELDSRQAARLFGRFAMLWCGIWTLVPAILLPSPGTYDVIEQFIIGREWVMGSIQHPPLPFWILEIFYQLCGQSIVAAYFCGAFISMLGLWVVWRLSRYYLSETLALLVVLATAAYRYFNMGNVNYTTSTPPVMIWCLSIFLLFRAVKFHRYRDWIGLGLALGAGMLCKYSVGILVLTMVLYLCLDREVRRFWKTPGPWITTFCALLVFLPHLVWVIQHDFPTVKYAADSLSGTGSWTNHFITPARFAGSQIFLILPMIIPLIPLLGFAWQLRWRKIEPDTPEAEANDDRFRRRFLSFMIFVPFIIQLLVFGLCGGGRMRPAYGSPLWTLTVLWFVSTFQVIPGKVAMKRTIILSAIVLLITVFCYIFTYQFRYSFTNEPCRAHFPAKAVGTALDRAWMNVYPIPCPYLSGDWKIAGQASLYMKGRPSVLCYYHGLGPDKHPDGFWCSDEDVKREGGIIVWKAGDGVPPDDIPEYLARRFPTAQVRPDRLTVPWQTPAKNLPPLKLRFAIVPPSR